MTGVIQRDFTLVAFAREFYANKRILQRYPFFISKFNSTWSSSPGEPEVSRGLLVLKEKYITATSLYHLIEYMHDDFHFRTRTDCLATFSILLEVISTADFFGVDDLVQLCVSDFYNSLTSSTISDGLNFVEETELTIGSTLKQFAAYFVLQTLYNLPDEVVDALPFAVVLEAITSDDCYVPTEFDRYSFLISYAQGQIGCGESISELRNYLGGRGPSTLREMLTKAFLSVRLDWMTPEELELVARDAVINEEDIFTAYRSHAIVLAGGRASRDNMRRSFAFSKLHMLSAGQQESLEPFVFAGSLLQLSVTLTRARQLGLALVRLPPAEARAHSVLAPLSMAGVHQMGVSISVPGGIHGFWRLKCDHGFTFGSRTDFVGTEGLSSAVGRVVLDLDDMNEWCVDGKLLVSVNLIHDGFNAL
ncbi:BTB/POZ domain [Carpediemonas membranifera]|uniref:BTB/POZ domain n=1 Tax=Carpediemonas membranifera TaxID=201153 RepID=A0A8J6E3U2_9EUKA|nr:BTB/POZ domain [Carpediemonas membranifera]|eukprot:KAG9396383.1 BTB/POZ domain [Carpediemonas membranifera]